MRDSEQIRNEIEDKSGFFAPFFAPALETPDILDNLWQQTLVAYINNPLPALFKEKLFAYLSRYCAVPYCVVCHSCALRPLGMRARDVLRMLEESPWAEELPLRAQLQMLLESPPLRRWPQPATELENAIFRLCQVAFLERPPAELCLAALRHALSPKLYNYLVAFLCYIKTCFIWVEAHPELSYEADERARQHLQPLLEQEPALAAFFEEYRDRIREEQADWAAQLAYFDPRKDTREQER